MAAPVLTQIITGATAAVASTAAIGSSIPSSGEGPLSYYDSLEIEADLTGPTGGTLDLYVQRSFDGGTTWRDYIHFPQVAATVTTRFSVSPALTNTIVVVGQNTSPALAVNTCAGGKWGPQLRLLATTGVGTSVAGSVTVKFTFSRNEKHG